MVRIETLGSELDLPLEIPSAMGGHSGPPTAVVDAATRISSANLMFWNDDLSQTIGVARFNSVIVLTQRNLEGVSIDLMRPAKGRGWVALEAKVKGQPSPITLLQSLVFTTEALNWLLSHKSAIESVFGLEVEIHDHGSDY